MESNKDEIIKIIKEAGGVLGMQKNSINSIFEKATRIFGISNSEFKHIVVTHPEFILQNRKHIFLDKMQLIIKNTNFSQYYLKRVFLRHPSLFLLSLSSFKVKTRFFIVEMGKTIDNLLLYKFNYGQHIKPRCELVFYEIGRDFDLEEVLSGTDEEF